MTEPKYFYETYPTAQRVCDCGEMDLCHAACPKLTAYQQQHAPVLRHSMEWVGKEKSR